MADNDIIDFYKKADNGNTPEKPLKEQVETPEPAVSETIAIPVPESNDPFDKFLYNLADKIKDSKPVIPVVAETEQQPESQDEPFNKFLLELADKLQGEKVITKQQQLTLEEQVKQPTPADPDDDDPFKSFIGSFANILKQDELINREENIKEATINFINKLKEQPEEPFIIEDEIEVKPKTKSKVKNKKYLPPVLTKKTQKQVLPVQEKEPVVQEQSDTLVTTKSQPDDNSYVKELKQADKNKLQIKKDKTSTDIKSVVEKQVAEILSRYPNLGFTGGGGGTNAVQYAEGGTMNGNLTVNGTVNATTYLSGGVNLYNLLSSTGGGENSQTLVYSTLTEELSITNGNSVSLSSLSDKSYANSNFLKLSGGTISGNLTVQGNISALGTATFANTIFTTTSALSVVNTGPGPALYVFQASGPYDVASFYDGDGIEVLHVGNAGPGGFGKVGVNESFPNEELTVRGSISATETIFVNRVGIGTDSPNSALTVVGNVSATGTTTINGNTFINGRADIGAPNAGVRIDNYTIQGLGGGLDIRSSSGNTGFNFDSGGIRTVNAGVFFRHDGPLFEQRNGISPTTLRLYNTYTAGTPVSSEFGYTRWSGNTFQIGTSATGSGSNRNIQITPAGNPALTISSGGSVFLGNGINQDSRFFGWSGNAGARAVNSTVGIITLLNWNEDGFNRLQFGGTTAAFPALKNSLSGIQIRRADDSDFAPLTASNITATNYLSAGVNLLDIFSGGGGTVEKRFDFVTTGGIDYSYSGTAAQYTIETSPTWKLIRLTYNNNGTISNSASALDSWTGRLTATYV